MRRLVFILATIGFLVFGGWLLLHRDQIQSPGDFFRLMGQQISKLGGGAVPQYAPWRRPAENVIRIGSFNANGFDEAKMKDPRIVAVMSDIIRHFDAIAIQEIDSSSQFALKRFVNGLNATGRNFEIIRGVPQPGTGSEKQSAILYDASTLELENGQHYHINDPDNLMQRDPLVAWFRTRANAGAFTFTLVNVHLDPQSRQNEAMQISQIFRAVRNDGRQEDDVILAGDFGCSSMQLNELAIAQGLQAVNVDASTDTSGTTQLDNFMLDPLATSEFTGETGVFDFMKLYNLTLTEALTVSDHLPIWAEFEVFETAGKERFAEVDASEVR